MTPTTAPGILSPCLIRDNSFSVRSHRVLDKPWNAIGGGKKWLELAIKQEHNGFVGDYYSPVMERTLAASYQVPYSIRYSVLLWSNITTH